MKLNYPIWYFNGIRLEQYHRLLHTMFSLQLLYAFLQNRHMPRLKNTHSNKSNQQNAVGIRQMEDFHDGCGKDYKCSAAVDKFFVFHGVIKFKVFSISLLWFFSSKAFHS